MPTYTTQHITNLSTGKPFQFEISQDKFDAIEKWNKKVKTQRELIYFNPKISEFTLFASYHEVRKIFIKNGFTDELVTQILTEFGLSINFIGKLLDDDVFIQRTMPWFEGVAQDGTRAATTLHIVYEQAKGYFTPLTVPWKIDRLF